MLAEVLATDAEGTISTAKEPKGAEVTTVHLNHPLPQGCIVEDVAAPEVPTVLVKRSQFTKKAVDPTPEN